MIISWYGQSCFKIQTRPKRGSEEITIFTDPFDKAIGLRPPQGHADIVTISHSHFDHNNYSALKDDPFIIDSAGEYSLKGIHFEGIESFHDEKQGEERGRNTIFLIESEELRICHLGDLGHVLSEKQVETLGEIDILMVPIGGKYTLDAKKAEEVIGQIEPGIIIPMHYKLKDLKVDIEDEKEFCKAFGEKSNGESKLVLKKKDLDEVENKLVLLDVANS
jgi:L-ascorbate metabolism protein UlaG (beta-lactamase superfamily)